MKILHITSHLGKGIGKFLSGLVEQSKTSHPLDEHLVISLEINRKSQFITKIFECGGKVMEFPTINNLEKMMKNVDIVQLEFWNHPMLFKYLCNTNVPPIRLITICHNNGLYNPIIPEKLITESHKTVFTTPCSLTKKEYNKVNTTANIGYVFSSGGFKDIPEPENKISGDDKISVGCIGSTNFSKMHPNYIDYLSAVKIQNFKVKIIGDLHNQVTLNQYCNYKDKSGMLKFTGFVPDIVEELKPINVLAHLLNPTHYGTTENALLECMAMGIVPVVLDNQPEKCIVKDNETGFVVHNESDFTETIRYLSENPKERQRIGNNASKFVRENFSVEKTENSLNNYYQEIMLMEKRKVDFKEIFGNTPSEWFLSCQNNDIKKVLCENAKLSSIDPMLKYGLYEENKGSVFQFSEYFPEDKELRNWSKNLKSLV